MEHGIYNVYWNARKHVSQHTAVLMAKSGMWNTATAVYTGSQLPAKKLDLNH